MGVSSSCAKTTRGDFTDAVREMGECNWTKRSEELDEEQTSRIKSSVLESRKGIRTLKGKVVETIVETSESLTVTEQRVRGDVSESHQQEVKKAEEQASAVT